MSKTPFAIQSIASDRVLLFHNVDQYYFMAELRGLGVTASIRVYAPLELNGLPIYFERIAAHELPWDGCLEWESLEGELGLEARCSRLGSVSITVHMRNDTGGAECWKLTAGIETELGQLGAISSAAGRFFQTG